MVDFNIKKYETIKLYNRLNHIKKSQLYDLVNSFFK